MRAEKIEGKAEGRASLNVYVLLADSGDEAGIEKTISSLDTASNLHAVNLKIAVLGHGNGPLQTVKRSGILSSNRANDIAALLKDCLEGDLALFLKSGDEVHETFFEILHLLECGRYDLCLFDMAIEEDGRIYPLFLPGVNFIHSLNCDYFRSRFCASASKTYQKLATAAQVDPYLVAISLLSDIERQYLRQKCQHVTLPLIRIGETKAAMDHERRRIQREAPAMRYSFSDTVAPRLTASVIICTKDKGFWVQHLVDRLLWRYPTQISDIIIVSNQTENLHALRILNELSARPGVKVIDYDKPFNFSEQCNLGAREASGEVLVFMNNDIVPATETWLDELLAPFASKDVGAVGPLLLYPDERVQHCGMFMGFNAVAGHEMRFGILPDDEYMFMATVPREVMAVTGAVLAVQKELFFNLNGFDRQLSLYIQDVDLCMRIHYSGKRVVLNPRSVLFHLESISIKPTLEQSATMERRRAQYIYFRNRWKNRVFEDPFHNPNFYRNDESMRSLAQEYSR